MANQDWIRVIFVNIFSKYFNDLSNFGCIFVTRPIINQKMKTLINLSILLLFSFFLSTCGLLNTKENKCGEEVDNDIELYKYSLFKDSSLYSMQYQYNSSSQQTTVSFFSPIYENVCTDEHASVSVKVLLDRNDTTIVPKARADWYPLWGSEIALTLDKSNILVYDGSYEIGLKQVYKDQPGRFYVSWSLTFPSQRDRRSDLIWLNNRVTAIHIDSHYYLAL
jgi:hypothetical protein